MSTNIIVNSRTLRVFALIAAAVLSIEASALAQSGGDACYVPSTGNVYRVNAPNTLPACRPGHSAFNLGGFSLPYSANVSHTGPLIFLQNTGTGPVMTGHSVAVNHTAFFRNNGTGSGLAAYSSGWTALNGQNQGNGHAIYGQNATGTPTAVFKNLSHGIAGSFEGRVNISLHNDVTGNFSPLTAQGASAGPAGYFKAFGAGTAIKAESNGTGYTAIEAVAAAGNRHALYAASNNASHPTLAIVNQAGGRSASFSGEVIVVGNMIVNGNQSATGSKNAVVATSSGARLLHAEESSEVWFSDHGFGKVENGRAWIAIDPIFAETVSLERAYHVFIEEYGDAELYVSKRTSTGFEVKLSRGQQDVEFSYRLMAKRRGFEDRRLDRAPDADVIVQH